MYTLPAEWYIESVWQCWYRDYGTPTAKQFVQLVAAISVANGHLSAVELVKSLAITMGLENAQ